jgi:hypothetical protein
VADRQIGCFGSLRLSAAMRLANGYADALSSLVYADADADRKDEHCRHAPSSANVSILLSTGISGSE